MPCLNEVQTVGACVGAARRCAEEHGLREVVVVGRAEGGFGRGMGGAMGGSGGRFNERGDADLSYDFGEGMKFVEKLREGNDLVMGTRFGPGARVEPGAMPWKHRWLGNPVLSF